MTPTIQVREVPARPALLVHARFPNDQIGHELGRIFGDVMRWAGRHEVHTAGPAFARYASWDAEQCELDAGVVVDAPPTSTDAPISVGKIGGCLAACATHVGPYEELHATYDSMQAWMAANGYEPAGQMWEEYLTSPRNTPPERAKTAIYWPVRKAS